jgi:hypothetical protein
MSYPPIYRGQPYGTGPLGMMGAVDVEMLAALFGLGGTLVGAAVSTGAVVWQQSRATHDAERAYLQAGGRRRGAALHGPLCGAWLVSKASCGCVLVTRMA